ncbi:hypothetical protein EDC30_103241 [Paucimonas lemoignei]|uniref:Uncharacterized protein n=1 Tax=Paucimonas lemoignei TaxID=29443 RepID=A0A4R3I244_PAULE|nr:hypothetical protein [Paucimonas lemoignei]TCS37949.1 hypothetical protein EDC30_103241 [Paucimonas lemoignei]
MPFPKSEAALIFSLGMLLPMMAQATDVQPLPATGDQAVQEQPHAMLHAAGPATTTPTANTEAETMEKAEAAEAAAPPPATEEIAGMGASIPLEALEQHRGGSSVNAIKSEAVSNGLLQDATATNVATGNNTIADGAFSHAIGLPIVIQNSGANVLIQNSTIVNVQFR